MGIEPTTFCLQDRCSATKLSRLHVSFRAIHIITSPTLLKFFNSSSLRATDILKNIESLNHRKIIIITVSAVMSAQHVSVWSTTKKIVPNSIIFVNFNNKFSYLYNHYLNDSLLYSLLVLYQTRILKYYHCSSAFVMIIQYIPFIEVFEFVTIPFELFLIFNWLFSLILIIPCLFSSYCLYSFLK